MESQTPDPDIPTLLYSVDQNLQKNVMAQSLWARSHYEPVYEVKIMGDDDDDDVELKKDIDEILNSNKYLCHICNSNVPKSYAKEHNESKKHKTCYEIADIALERTRNQMQLEIFASRKTDLSDTYFCEPCSIVVLNSNKKSHEATEIHTISVQYDEILQRMINIYKDFNPIKANGNDRKIDELTLFKERIEVESLADVESLNTDEECDDQDNTEDYDVKTCLKNGFKEFLKHELNVETFRDDILKALRHEYDTFIKELFYQVNNIVTESNNIIEARKKNALLVEQRKLEYEKVTLEYKVKLAELISRSEKESNRESKADKNMSQTKVRMLKKLQKAKLKEQANNQDSNSTEVSENFDHNKYTSEQSSSLVILKEDKEKLASPAPTDPLDLLKKVTDILDVTTGVLNNHEKEFYSEKKAEIESVLNKHFHENCTVQALKNEFITKNKIKSKHKEGSGKNNGNNKSEKHISEEKMEINNNTVLIPHFAHKNITPQENQKDNVTKQTGSVDSRPKQELTDNEPKNEPASIIQKLNANKLTKGDKQIKTLVPNTEKSPTKQIDKPKIAETLEKLTKKDEKTSKPEDESPRNPTVNTKCYLKDLARKCDTKPIHSIEAVTANIVQITAINGDRFRITLNNFHSFHVKKGDMYCKVCQCSNIRRPELHIVESEHRAKIMTPIEDANGIRQIDDIWSHCVLCNNLTNNIECHSHSMLHRSKVQQTLVKDNQQNWTQNTSLIDLIASNHLTLTNKNYVNCNICDVIVTHELNSIRRHVSSFEHFNNLEVKVVENYIYNIESTKYYCIPCDAHVEKVMLGSHINGKKHRCMLEEYLVRIGQRIALDQREMVTLTSISQNVKKLAEDNDNSLDSLLICFVCNAIIFSEEDHMNTLEHKKNYVEYLESNLLREVEPGVVFCITCDTIITSINLMCHCMSNKHKYTLTYLETNGRYLDNIEQNTETNVQRNVPNEDMSNTASNVMSNVNMSDKDMTDSIKSKASIDPGPSTSKQNQTSNPASDTDNDMPIKVLYQFKEVKSADNFLCMICDDRVQHSLMQTIDHMVSNKHIVAFNLLMLWNKIKKKDDRYFCDICQEDLTYFSEIEHVLSDSHERNVGLLPKSTVYEYDRTLLTHAYVMSNKEGDRFKFTPNLTLENDK